MSVCGTCKVPLGNGEELRDHYNSELHLANVRRRVEGLRPLNAQEQRHMASDLEGTSSLDASGAPVYSCTLCKKTFRSVQTLQTHIRSTAHLMKKEQRIIARDSEAATQLSMTTLGSAAMGLHKRHNAKKVRQPTEPKPKGPKVSVEDREEDVTETRCMFCGHSCANVEENVAHLLEIHQFAIPMEDHCSNVGALLSYLARKVNGLMCIVCNEKSRAFASLEALRAHMHEKNHERLILGPEYQEFYDCPLEDPENPQKAELVGVRGDELVLASDKEAKGKKRVIMRREEEVPRPRQRETQEQTEKRRLITNAENEALAVARQEQRELMTEQHKDTAMIAKRSGAKFQDHQLKVNLRSNKLHPKGYDGEGTVN